MGVAPLTHSRQTHGSPYPAQSSVLIIPTALLTWNMFVDLKILKSEGLGFVAFGHVFNDTPVELF